MQCERTFFNLIHFYSFKRCLSSMISGLVLVQDSEPSWQRRWRTWRVASVVPRLAGKRCFATQTFVVLLGYCGICARLGWRHSLRQRQDDGPAFPPKGRGSRCHAEMLLEAGGENSCLNLRCYSIRKIVRRIWATGRGVIF